MSQPIGLERVRITSVPSPFAPYPSTAGCSRCGAAGLNNKLGDMAEILTPQVVMVPDLIVQVATGGTCYPGENGFSAHWAEVTTTDSVLLQRLSTLAEGKTQVLLRCATLDITGRMTKIEKTKDGTRFVFSIDDLFYRKPEVARNVI